MPTAIWTLTMHFATVDFDLFLVRAEGESKVLDLSQDLGSYHIADQVTHQLTNYLYMYLP